jgi:hypothetical protein
MTGSPPPQLITQLAATTGLSDTVLVNTSTYNVTGKRDRYYRYSRNMFIHLSTDHVRYYNITYCPECLSDQEEKTFLVTWRNAFTFLCPIHNSIMRAICPECGKAPTGLPWHPSKTKPGLESIVPTPGTCQAPQPGGSACNFPLQAAPAGPKPPEGTDWLACQIDVILSIIGSLYVGIPPGQLTWELDLLVCGFRRTPPDIAEVVTLVPAANTPEIIASYQTFRTTRSQLPHVRRKQRPLADPDVDIPPPEIMWILCALALEMRRFASPHLQCERASFPRGADLMRITSHVPHLAEKVSERLERIVETEPPIMDFTPLPVLTLP